MRVEVEAHLIAMELRLQDPAVRRDAAAVGEMLSAEFREFGASGRVWDRAGILAQLAGEAPVQMASEEFRCEELGPGVALLTYVCRSATRRTLRSSVWRMEGSGWRMVFHQGTVAAG